jgi:Family of unknown function (DUF5670)
MDVCTRGQTPVTAGLYHRWGSEKEIIVLGTLIIILLVLWLLGIVTSFTLGGFIHILLVVAIVVILVRVIQGRNPLQG